MKNLSMFSSLIVAISWISCNCGFQPEPLDDPRDLTIPNPPPGTLLLDYWAQDIRFVGKDSLFVAWQTYDKVGYQQYGAYIFNLATRNRYDFASDKPFQDLQNGTTLTFESPNRITRNGTVIGTLPGIPREASLNEKGTGAVFINGPSLNIYDITSSTSRTLCSIQANWPITPLWRGDTVIYLHYDLRLTLPNLFSISVKGGNSRQLSSKYAYSAKVSGSLIAFQSQYERAIIIMQDSTILLSLPAHVTGLEIQGDTLIYCGFNQHGIGRGIFMYKWR